MGGLQTSHFLQGSPDPTLRPPGTSLTDFSLLSRLLLLLPGGMCQVCAGLRLQGPPLCQVQLLQIGTPSCTSGGAAHLGGQRRITLLCMFFFYICVQIIFSVCHARRVRSYLNKVMCI